MLKFRRPRGAAHPSRILAAKAFVALFVFGCCTLRPTPAAGQETIDVWPGKPADDDASKIGEEKWLDPRPGAKWQKWVTNVTRPTLTIFRPAKERDTGAAVIICPGGGYHALMWDLEGEEAAEWLNSLGITGIILKYRCPRRPGDPLGVPASGPLKDAQRAVRVVRSKAAEWKLDPKRIGMMGFSAGGHLVGATATTFARPSYAPKDEIDKLSCRPDFGILAYSGYFFPPEKQMLSPTVATPADAPPMFFVHAADDPVKGSEVENSIQLCTALRRVGVLAEMHIYAKGGHGFGVRRDGGPCSGWTIACADWLRNQGILPAEPRKKAP
jgi:acetyl esterase/lipase